MAPVLHERSKSIVATTLDLASQSTQDDRVDPEDKPFKLGSELNNAKSVTMLLSSHIHAYHHL